MPFADAGGHELFYRVVGEGPLRFFLTMGMGGTTSQWEPQASGSSCVQRKGPLAPKVCAQDTVRGYLFGVIGVAGCHARSFV